MLTYLGARQNEPSDELFPSILEGRILLWEFGFFFNDMVMVLTNFDNTI